MTDVMYVFELTGIRNWRIVLTDIPTEVQVHRIIHDLKTLEGVKGAEYIGTCNFNVVSQANVDKNFIEFMIHQALQARNDSPTTQQVG